MYIVSILIFGSIFPPQVSSQMQKTWCHKQIFQTHLKIDLHSRNCFIYRKHPTRNVRIGVSLKESKRKSFVLESSVCITIQQTHREKGRDTIFFTDSRCSKMQCSHSMGLYLLFLADEIQCTLWCAFSVLWSTQHILPHHFSWQEILLDSPPACSLCSTESYPFWRL